MTEEEPKIQIDTDWKAEAQAEKERLAKKESEADPGERPRPGELPKADFRTLVGAVASQAFISLGALGDPKSGRVVVDLPGAKFAIDLLGVLAEKTKGNITEEEAKELTQVLAELRARFVQFTNLVAQQSVAGAETGGPAAAEPPLPPAE